MAPTLNRRIVLVACMLILLSLVAPIVTSASTQDEGAPADASEPAAADTDSNAAAPTVATETPTEEAAPPEPPPATTEEQPNAPPPDEPEPASVTEETAAPPADQGAQVEEPAESIAQVEEPATESSLTITVLDATSNAAIGGASVAVYDANWNPLVSGTTDGSGVFVAAGLAEGHHYVEASAAGYLTSTIGSWVSGATEITIWLELAPQAGAMTFLVTDESGTPIAEAAVTVYDPYGTPVAAGATDAGGGFTTGELAAGTYYVEVTHAAYHSWSDYLTVNGPVEFTITLQHLPDPGILTIHVVDADTLAPIAGATVTVWAGDGISGTTDETGTFATGELPGGEYYTEVTAEGYYIWAGQFGVNGPSEHTASLSPLPSPGTLTIRVIDAETTAPIAGASVQVWANGYITGTTDDNGVFTTPELPIGSYPVEVSADGYLGTIDYPWVDGPTERTVALNPIPDGTLTVTVSEPWGTSPIAGASVVVTDTATGNEVATGTTGADGAFTTGTLEGGWYDVSVTADGYLPAASQRHVSGPTSISFWLQPAGGTLTVTVVDQLTGAPVAGAAVTVLTPWWSVVADGTTDAAGVFVTGELEPAEYFVQITAAGYFSLAEGTSVRGDTAVTFALDPYLDGTLTVRVAQSGTDEPIRKATVTVSDAEGNEVASGTTDASGMFVTGTLSGGYYNIHVTAGGYGENFGYTLVDGPTEEAFWLAADGPGVLTITVIDAVTGDPIQGATVEVYDQATWTVVANGTTKKSGVFTTGKLPGGDYHVRAKAEGHFSGEHSVRVGGDTGTTIQLYPSVPGTLTVTVRDRGTDAPIAGADVVITGGIDWTPVATGKTGADGIFTSEQLDVGGYGVSASADGYLSNMNLFAFVNGDAEVTLYLTPAGSGTLTVHVTDHNGAGIPNAAVRVRDAVTGAEVATGVTDTSGVLVTAELPGGTYGISVTADGYSAASGESVAVNGPAVAWIGLQPGEPGALTVTAVGEAGPIAGADVVVRNWDGEIAATGTTGDDGIFVTGALAPGGYRVDVNVAGYYGPMTSFVAIDGPTEFQAYMVMANDTGLQLSATDVDAGANVKVEGIGFQPGERVVITWHAPNGMVLATTKAKSDGSISDHIVVPDVPDGRYAVVAIGTDSHVTGVAWIIVGELAGP